ncbi:MAG TPA: tRNA (pseudouridine(54)-N(1))-methyltransferase TrmY [Methanocorpusculum sp.]|nr:tRNA (pseudouridine(54)-N(1))-methyltransferase TrmY [Methanocorpusculum sp.]
MIRIVIIGHKDTTNPNFPLNDMPGMAGRMDVLCRCVNSTFFLSHDLRRNTECYLILQGDPVTQTICFSGKTLKSLNPDERSSGALIKKGLSIMNTSSEYKFAGPGIAIRTDGLKRLLSEYSFAILDENGKDIRDVDELPENYILSDHLNFTEEEEELFKELPRYSVGPRVLHADHAITVILNEFDRRGLE